MDRIGQQRNRSRYDDDRDLEGGCDGQHHQADLDCANSGVAVAQRVVDPPGMVVAVSVTVFMTASHHASPYVAIRQDRYRPDGVRVPRPRRVPR